MAVRADLSFEVSVPGGADLRGSLRGQDDRLVLDVDDVGTLAGAGRSPVSRALAETMASRSLVVRVVSDGVHLATVGAVVAPWWQQVATGSRNIELGSLRGARMALVALLRRRGARDDALSYLRWALTQPPPTPFPLAPTLVRPDAQDGR